MPRAGMPARARAGLGFPASFRDQISQLTADGLGIVWDDFGLCSCA
jgi:hypothetical protein